MNRIIDAELYKLKKNKAFWLSLILIVAFYLASAFVSLPELGHNPKSATLQGNMSSFATILPLFMTIIATALAQKDYNYGTMKNVISSGASRKDIYLGRLVVGILAMFILFVVDGVVSMAAVAIAGGNMSVDILIVMKALFIQLIVSINYVVFDYMIGSLIHNSTIAILICYLYYMFGAAIFGLAGAYLNISGLNNYTLPGIERNAASAGPLQIIIVTIIILLMACVGYKIFEKQDIH